MYVHCIYKYTCISYITKTSSSFSPLKKLLTFFFADPCHSVNCQIVQLLYGFQILHYPLSFPFSKIPLLSSTCPLLQPEVVLLVSEILIFKGSIKGNYKHIKYLKLKWVTCNLFNLNNIFNYLKYH